MLKKTLITIIIMLLMSLLYAQEVKLNSSLSSGVVPAKSIVLDINSQFFKDEYSEIAKKQFLFKLRIINSGSGKILDSLPILSATSIDVLEFQDITGGDFYTLTDKLVNCKTIGVLSLKNVKISDIPVSFIKEKNISTLQFEDCKTISPLSFHLLLTDSVETKKIMIRNCALYSLPDKLSLPYIEVIDLRDNKLTSAGQNLCDLNSLDSVYLSGNFIPDPVNDLEYLIKSNVRFIETDSVSLSVNQNIREKMIGKTIVFHNIEDFTDKLSNSFFGQFKTGNPSFIIYSDAYLQYEKLLSNPLFIYNPDTLSFEEKFWDTSGNVRPYLMPFRIFKEKNVVKKHINFGFKESKETIRTFIGCSKCGRSNFYRQHPEMNIFRRYTWVIKAQITPGDFRNYSKIDFIDLRIRYDGVDKFFTLYLKKVDGSIIWLGAYPVKKGNKHKNAGIWKKYPSEYARYLSALDRHSRQLDKDLYRNKQKIHTAVIKNKRNLWNTLRSYMSIEEREMTETEWLKYYTNALRYEDEALKSSYPGEVLLCRQLEKLGYINRYSKAIDSLSVKIIPAFFVDNNGVNIPVKKVVLIDRTSFTYKIISVKSPLDPVMETIPVENNVVMLVYLPDSSVGIVKNKNIGIAIKNNCETGIKTSVVEPGLITIGQIINDLKLY